jgi:tetratricopeptide (TPR) repeat protein
MESIYYAYIGIIVIYLVFLSIFSFYEDLSPRKINPLFVIESETSGFERVKFYVFIFFLHLFSAINWIVHACILVFMILKYGSKLGYPPFSKAIGNFFPVFHLLGVGNFILISLIGHYLLFFHFSYLGFTLLLLLVLSTIFFLGSFMISSLRIIDYVKIRNHDIKIDFLLLTLPFIFSSIIGAFFLELLVFDLPFSFSSLTEVTSNLFSYKKLRLYYWGYLDSLLPIDYLIAFLGLLLTSSIIKSFFKLRKEKRSSSDFLEIAEALIGLGKYEKANETLEKIWSKGKGETYFEYKAYLNLGLRNFDEAIHYTKEILPKDEYYSKDHCFDLLIARCPYELTNLDFLEEFFIKWIQEMQTDALFIRALLQQFYMGNLSKDSFNRILEHADEEEKDFQFSILIFDYLEEEELDILEDYQPKNATEELYIGEIKGMSAAEFDLPIYLQDQNSALKENIYATIETFVEKIMAAPSTYELDLFFMPLQIIRARFLKRTELFEDFFEQKIIELIDVRKELKVYKEKLDSHHNKLLNDLADHMIKRITES